MNLRKHHEGLSLLEVVIGWMLLSFLFLFFGTIFFRYIKEFQKLEDDIEIQYQVEEALDRWTHLTYEMQKITRIENEKKENILYKTGTYQVKKIIFDQNLIFEHHPESNRFFYGHKLSYGNILCAEHIESILITPLPKESTFAQCKGIKISIQGKKNKASIWIDTEFYFRLLEE
ncbi:MAG: hypothetical protein GX238_03215 [Epulopiscium sp.]|nr:hypothetical protein [Candidatus Epulonipiscium sp.]